MMDCTHPARPDWLRITDPSEALNCPDFASIATGARNRPQLLRVIRTGLIAAALGLVVMLGGVRLYRAATESGPPVSLRATVSAPAESSADSGLMVRVLVLNQGDYPAEGVQVVIGGKSMRNLTCQAVEPPECLVEATPRSASARIGRIEPGAIGSVAFRFSVRRPGDFELVAQVSAANAPVPERIPIEGELLP